MEKGRTKHEQLCVLTVAERGNLPTTSNHSLSPPHCASFFQSRPSGLRSKDIHFERPQKTGIVRVPGIGHAEIERRTIMRLESASRQFLIVRRIQPGSDSEEDAGPSRLSEDRRQLQAHPHGPKVQLFDDCRGCRSGISTGQRQVKDDDHTRNLPPHRHPVPPAKDRANQRIRPWNHGWNCRRSGSFKSSALHFMGEEGPPRHFPAVVACSSEPDSI